MEVITGAVDLRDADGARIVVGASEVWRTLPAPRTRLAAGPWQAQLTQAAAQATPTPALSVWGVGPAVQVQSGAAGLAWGVAVATPTWTVLGWGLGLAGTATLGAAGATATAALVVRP